MANQKRTPATITRWHVPNWRDASKYPTTGADLSDEEWRWEFLRRLPEYREGWEDLEPRLTLPKGDPARVLSTSREVCAFGARFGLLLGLPNPRENYARAAPVFARSPRLAQNPNCINIAFDPSRKINEQLDDARSYLLAIQRAASYAPPEREHRDGWPLLLRVLDARDETPYHATFQQIGETLSPIAGRIKRGGRVRLKQISDTEAATYAKEWHKAATDLMYRRVLGKYKT